MGLVIYANDDNCDIWQGSYSSFRKFRKMVAMFLGLQEYLKDCKPESDNDFTVIIGNKFTSYRKQANELKSFEEKYPGTFSFFSHSDCEGEWQVDECKQIEGLLQTVVRNFSDTNTIYIKRCKQEINQVIEGLNYCSKNNQKAIFC